VEQLTDRKKEGLAKVFTAISENFKRVYAELSEGGEADLVLEDPEKPFDAGLILKVKPAHKKVLRLEALSGGEKSLASMALIFAIQEYDPSPFYLLDEIDQNLDAINAEKVARMIRRNSTAAQFVQISLRKVSLKEADHLIGVRMKAEAVFAAFDLVLERQMDPWEINLVPFTKLFLDKVKKDGSVNFVTAGKLVFLAWSILKLQSDKVLLDAMPPEPTPEDGGWDLDMFRD